MAGARKTVKVAVEVPTWVGTKVVEVELTGSELRVAKDPVILKALAAVKVDGISKFADFKALDEVVREAYRRSRAVKRLVDAKALAKVNGDEDLARAYVRAWLKAGNWELPEDDPDAEQVSRQYYKLIWKMGSKYVLQDAPWM
jgi:hypothetical protein